MLKLLEQKVLHKDAMELLRALLKADVSILISGGIGVGKNALLKDLLKTLPMGKGVAISDMSGELAALDKARKTCLTTEEIEFMKAGLRNGADYVVITDLQSKHDCLAIVDTKEPVIATALGSTPQGTVAQLQRNVGDLALASKFKDKFEVGIHLSKDGLSMVEYLKHGSEVCYSLLFEVRNVSKYKSVTYGPIGPGLAAKLKDSVNIDVVTDFNALSNNYSKLK